MPATERQRSAAELFGVQETPANARDRLLDKSIDLFYRYGFHAVGLDRVIAETGVTKTTFYKHFESKDDLMAAAIARREEWESRAWARAVREQGGDDPRRQLVAMFDVMDVWFNDPMFHGCLFVNAAVQFADPRDPVHVVAAEYKRRSRDNWRDLAKSAGATDAETFADLYAAVVEGTMIMRHVHGRNDAARVTKPLAERLVEQYMPGGATASAPSPGTPGEGWGGGSSRG